MHIFICMYIDGKLAAFRLRAPDPHEYVNIDIIIDMIIDMNIDMNIDMDIDMNIDMNL